MSVFVLQATLAAIESPRAGAAETRAPPTGTATWPHHAGFETRLADTARQSDGFGGACPTGRPVLKRHSRSTGIGTDPALAG